MKKTFTAGLVIGALVILPIGVGITYWLVKNIQNTRATVLYVEAHEHIKKNEVSRALAKLNQSVGADPYRDLTHLALAELYEKVGDRKLALQEFELTNLLCEGCYKIDEKIRRLQDHKYK